MRVPLVSRLRRSSQMSTGAPNFEGGRNIAMKVPPISGTGAAWARGGGRATRRVRARRLLLLTECLILRALGLGTVQAHAATPSWLVGETLTSEMVRGSTLTGTCNVPTKAGTFSFSVSGSAAGPFPGTFTESGSFTTEVGGSVTHFSSTFTITSTSGTVTAARALTSGGRAKHHATNFSTAYVSQPNFRSPPPIPPRSTAPSRIRAPRRSTWMGSSDRRPPSARASALAGSSS
jgi:hypothetical protein